MIRDFDGKLGTDRALTTLEINRGEVFDAKGDPPLAYKLLPD